MKFLIVFFCALLATSCATREQLRESNTEQYPQGKKFYGSVNVVSSRIPLPDGEWIVLGSGTYQEKKGGNYTYI